MKTTIWHDLITILSAVMLIGLAAQPAVAAEKKAESKSEGDEATPKSKTKSPKRPVCENPALSYQQRYLCGQQMTKVTTKPEKKKVEQRYTDIVREVEKEKKEAHE